MSIAARIEHIGDKKALSGPDMILAQTVYQLCLGIRPERVLPRPIHGNGIP